MLKGRWVSILLFAVLLAPLKLLLVSRNRPGSTFAEVKDITRHIILMIKEEIKLETGELLRKAGALQRKPFDKAKPKVLKFVVPVSMPGVVKEIVAGKCLVEFTSGDHGWFPSTDLISIIEAEQRGLINEQGV